MTRPLRGFSLVELALVVMIISILAFQGPDIFEQIRGSKYGRAVSDMAVLESGFWGLNEDSNGFVGDIGIAGSPGNGTNLLISNDLVTPTTGTTFQHGGAYLGVTYGWNGPYSGFGLNPALLNNDPWQNAYQLLADGRVWSYGMDGQANTADDIWSPSPGGNGPYSQPPAGGGPMLQAIQGNLVISVYDALGVKIRMGTNISVTVTNPNPSSSPAGALTHPGANWLWQDGYFLATGLWPGQHAVEVTGISGTSAACNGQENNTQLFRSEATATLTPDCFGIYGHAIGYVIGGSSAAVTVRIH